MAVQASQKEVHWQPWYTYESHVPCGLGRIAGTPKKGGAHDLAEPKACMMLRLMVLLL